MNVFTYVEEFDTAEHALDPDKTGLFIKVKIRAIRVNSISIRQKEDNYDSKRVQKEIKLRYAYNSFANLNERERKIYRTGFRTGYKLARQFLETITDTNKQ